MSAARIIAATMRPSGSSCRMNPLRRAEALAERKRSFPCTLTGAISIRRVRMDG